MPNANTLGPGGKSSLQNVGNPGRQKALTVSADVDLTSAANLGGPAVAIYCNSAGTLTLQMADGVSVLYNVTAGLYIFGMFEKITISGTTATSVIALGP